MVAEIAAALAALVFATVAYWLGRTVARAGKVAAMDPAWTVIHSSSSISSSSSSNSSSSSSSSSRHWLDDWPGGAGDKLAGDLVGRNSRNSTLGKRQGNVLVWQW